MNFARRHPKPAAVLFVRPALYLILEKELKLGLHWISVVEELMAVLIDAIDVKRRTLFEIDNTPFSCLEGGGNRPPARGGQALVRLKIRNLIPNAVFDRAFKAGEKFEEPDLQLVPTSYLYSDRSG